MSQVIGYREIVKDYFGGYKRAFTWGRFILVIVILLNGLNPFRGDFQLFRYVAGFPIFFALISGAFHMVSLPRMMYLIPYTKQMREDYIQRMLYVKVGLPIAVSVIMDIVLLHMNKTLIRAIILQLITVFFITYLMAVLNDGAVVPDTYKVAFGGLSYFISAILVLCYMLSGEMYIVCSGEISEWEFWIILFAILSVFGLITLSVHKRWRTIRENFADYEIATSLEVLNRRW